MPPFSIASTRLPRQGRKSAGGFLCFPVLAHRAEARRLLAACADSLKDSLSQAGARVVLQVELAGFVIARMGSDVVQVKRPPLLCRRFLPPLPEVALLAVVLAVALACWRA